jgi:hypothetical protein
MEERLKAGTAPSLDSSFTKQQIDESLKVIDLERRAVTARLQFLNESRWPRCWKASRFFVQGHYRYFSGWKSYLKDLAFNHRQEFTHEE